jgi:hypothetical protein
LGDCARASSGQRSSCQRQNPFLLDENFVTAQSVGDSGLS